jgi:hypothetical protein
MKKIVFTLAIIASLISCKTETKKTEENTQTTESEVIETPTLALGEFNIKAGEFVGKEVKIQGIVDHVCKHSGKKLLVVTDDGDVHVTSDVRFDDTLKGNEISLVGVVLEDKIDEAYCLKMEEDNIKSHSEGASNQEQFENKKKHIQQYRDKMKAEGIDYISEFSLQYVSHTIVE